MGVRLPAEYQEVEYLLSVSGSSGHYSYINTGIKPAADVSIRGIFSFENGIYTSLFGSRTGNSTPQWFVSAPSVTNPASMGFWYNATRSYKKLTHNDDGDWFTVSMSNTEGTIVDDDGVTLFSVSFDAVDFPDVEMFLFVRSNGGSPASAGVVGCKRFTIYKAGSKIQDLIPCYRKADNKPGMYDLVTGTFFISAGDREFTVGPNVYRRLPEEYQEVEYLESSGTQYIDTGHSPTRNFGFDVKASTLFAQGSQVIAARTGTDNSNRIFLFGSGSQTQARFTFGGPAGLGYGYNYSYALDNVLRLELRNSDDWFCVNGDQRFKVTRDDYVKDNDNTILLFGTSGYGANKCLSTSRIYYAKFYESDTLVRDLIPCYRKADDKPGVYDLVSDTFFVNQGTEEFVVGPDVIDSISPWLIARRRSLIEFAYQPIPATAIGNPLTFETDIAKPLKSLVVPFTPIQEGSGDPSPDNVRPISGWTGCNITRTGKNLYNANALRYGYYAADGNYNVDNNLRSTQLIKVTGSNIAISWGTIVGSLVYLRTSFFDKDKVFIERHSPDNSPLSSNGYRIETCPSGTEYIVITFEHSQKNYVNNDKFQIELGSTVTTYEAYHVTTIPITFTDPSTGDPMTVYNGTLTLNEDGSADLVVKRYAYSPPISGRSIQHGTYSSRVSWSLPKASNTSTSSTKHGALCNVAKEMNAIWANSNYTNNSGTADGGFSIATTGTSLSVYDSDTAITAEEFAEKYNGLMVVYPLATPQTYHFDNVGQLITFIGTNNIWTDTNGTNTATYLKHRKLIL